MCNLSGCNERGAHAEDNEAFDSYHSPSEVRNAKDAEKSNSKDAKPREYRLKLSLSSQ